MAGKCSTDGCGSAAIALLIYDNPHEELDYCRDCALKRQRERRVPAAVIWKQSKVNVEYDG